MNARVTFVLAMVIGQLLLADQVLSKRNSGRKSGKPPKMTHKIFEGDIRVPKSFDPVKRNAVSDQGKLWPNGIVPYTISKSFDATAKKLFKDAMKMIEDATQFNGKKCVQFVPRKQDKNYVQLSKLKDCWSDLGRLGTGKQLVSLGRQCHSKGTVVHELMHSLGFYHEQSRADRDYYVDIHYDNIHPGAEINFKKYALGASMDHLDQPYDYDSIMHYREDSFAKDPSKPTITPKTKLTNGVTLGQRDHLSEIDIRMVQKLYGCTITEVDEGDPNCNCRDKLRNCHLYGEYACHEQPTWAAENCALTCQLCTPVTQDVISDCDEYGTSICHGDYEQWARQNCAKFCGFVEECRPKTTTMVPDKPVECVDKISDCSSYGRQVCKTHTSWASERCANFCDLCPKETDATGSVTQTTTSASCEDKVDCSVYAKSACGIYPSYMKPNCPRHCELCPDQQKTKPLRRTISSSTTRKPTTTTRKPTTTTRKPTTTTRKPTTTTRKPTTTTRKPTTTTRKPTTTTKKPTTTTRKPTTNTHEVTASGCSDKINDCAQYSSTVCQDYSAWARLNCANHCGFCTTTQVTTPESQLCRDAIDNCADYSTSVCTNYAGWSKSNCNQFCGFCAETAETSTQGSSCSDKRGDCAEFASNICTEYRPWSMENCALSCNLCN